MIRRGPSHWAQFNAAAKINRNSLGQGGVGADRRGSVLDERKEQQMDNEGKSSKAGELAAEGLREATAKEEAKNESETGHDLAKGADRFEERSKSSDGKSAEEKQKG
jgi:hypothetical protein